MRAVIPIWPRTSREPGAPARWFVEGLRVGLGGLLLLAPVMLPACSGGDPLPSPIIVITIDTLRADHLGCYGYGRDTSPTIDEFATESVLFENTSTTIATTLPAHVSLWTSRYPLQTGIVANDLRFRAEISDSTPFFARMLSDAGYATAAIVSATPVKKESGIGVGFDTFDQPETAERDAAATTEAALEWLENRPADPFFLWVHYFDPHHPHEPPAPYDEAFQTDEFLLEFLRRRRFPLAEKADVQEANNLYDGEILFVDAQLRRLLDDLRARGLYDSATIVVTSDHGEGLGQRNHMGHGRIYNEHTHIPLIIKFPATDDLKGVRRSNLVSIVDVIPTLVNRLDLPVRRDSFEGVDALDDASPRDAVFAQRAFAPKKARWGSGQKFTLMTEEWKFHHSTNGNELYDMQRDAHELFNEVRDHRGVAAELSERLLSLVARYASKDEGLQVLEDLAPETLRELEKLGYGGQ